MNSEDKGVVADAMASLAVSQCVDKLNKLANACRSHNENAMCEKIRQLQFSITVSLGEFQGEVTQD